MRKPWCHKGDFGYLLVVAGSYRYTGSGIFNSLAALRTGCDLVELLSVRRASDIASSYKPDLITLPFDNTSHFLMLKHVKTVLKEVNHFDALLIGSGLGRNIETFKAVRRIVEEVSSLGKPIIIDADGIRAFRHNLNLLKNKKIIITPHSGEFLNLTGIKLNNNVRDRVSVVRDFSSKLGIVVLLKGHYDVISDGREVLINKTGSVFMTKGGFGDLLAGITASLVVQGLPLLKAAYYAARINGLAGKKVGSSRGVSMLASDTFDVIGRIRNKMRF